MNEIPNSPNMIGEFFGEGKSFSHQSRYSLSHRIIKSFYIVCQTSFLSYCLVSFLRKNCSIGKDKSLYNLRHIDDKLVAKNPIILERQLDLFCQYILLQFLWLMHQLPAQSTVCYPYCAQMTTFHHIELLAYLSFLTSLLLLLLQLLIFY